MQFATRFRNMFTLEQLIGQIDHFVGNKAKGLISKRVFQENEAH